MKIWKDTGVLRSFITLLILISLSSPLFFLIEDSIKFNGAIFKIFAIPVFRTQLFLSILVSIGTAITSAIFSTGGIICGLYEFKGRKLLEILLLSPLLIPPWFTAEIYAYKTCTYGLLPLVFTSGICLAPVFQILVSSSLRIVPRHTIELLVHNGKNSPVKLLYYLFPFYFPSFLSASLIVFLFSFSDYGSARIMRVETLVVAIFRQWFGSKNLTAGCLISLFVVLLCLVFAGVSIIWIQWRKWWGSEWLTKGSSGRIPLENKKILIPFVLAIPELISGVIFPWTVMLSWCFQRNITVDLPNLGLDLARTIFTAGTSTFFSAVLALAFIWRSSVKIGRFFNYVALILSVTLFVLPQTVTAIGFLKASSFLEQYAGKTILNETPSLLIFALAAKFSAVFLIAGMMVISTRAKNYSDLLILMNKRKFFSFLYLMKPLYQKTIIAVCCFVFLECMKDISMITLLSPFGWTTVSTKVFQYVQSQLVHQSSFWIVLLGVAGFYPLHLLARLSLTDYK